MRRLNIIVSLLIFYLVIVFGIVCLSVCVRESYITTGKKLNNTGTFEDKIFTSTLLLLL